MNINPMHTTVASGTNGILYLTNIEVDTVINLISFPIAPWADRAALGDVLREVGRMHGWY